MISNKRLLALAALAALAACGTKTPLALPPGPPQPPLFGVPTATPPAAMPPERGNERINP